MHDESKGGVDVARFRDLVKDIPFAMFTTVTESGSLRSRPMVAHGNAFDGSLWFFSRTSSAVASEIAANPHVNVAYVSAPEDRFVSVSGDAAVIRDVAQASRLWTSAYNQWFAGGAADPDSSLIKIEVERVDHWDAKAGRMQQL